MSRQNMFYWQADRPFTVDEIKTIFLDRKLDYSPSDLAKAASHAMAEELVMHDPINHGSVNIVCPFTTSSGKEGVIRAHPKQVKNEYFFSESEAMKLAYTAGVPVPNTVLVDDSRKIVPFDYMVTTRISGIVMKPAVQQDPSLHPIFLKQIGMYMAKLHSIKTQGYGFFDNEQARVGKLIGLYDSNEKHYMAALDLDEEFHLANSNHVGLELIVKAFKILKENAAIASCDQPTLVHNDIADWNTVVEGDQVTGILDWDECFSGDPVFDFATTSLFYTDDQMEILKSGYQQISKLPTNYEEKFTLYLIRYVMSKSKIAIKQLNSRQNDFMKLWLENAVQKLQMAIKKFEK